MLSRSGDRDRPHDETVLHADECGEARIDAGEFECHPSAEHRTVLELTGLLVRLSVQAEVGEARNDVAGKELRIRPEPVDDGAHLGLQILP